MNTIEWTSKKYDRKSFGYSIVCWYLKVHVLLDNWKMKRLMCCAQLTIFVTISEKFILRKDFNNMMSDGILPNYYETLQVPKGSSDAEIKKA